MIMTFKPLPALEHAHTALTFSRRNKAYKNEQIQK